MVRLLQYCSWLVLLFVITACGGGGGSSSSSSSSGAVKTGYFIDSPVKGLHYSTATQSGVTDSNGSFTYKSGETVTFKIGNVVIGSAVGNSLVTPLTLNQETDLSNVSTKTANVARILQTLDSGSSGSYIDIPSSLDTLTVDNVDFANESDLARIVSSAQAITTTNYTLKDATTAVATMTSYLTAYKTYEKITQINYTNSGTQYYLLSIPTDSNVYFDQFGSNSFNVGMALGGTKTMELYDLNMTDLQSPCCGMKSISKGNYILRVDHDDAGSTLLIDYPDLTDQTKFTALKNGTYTGINNAFYSLHMPSDGTVLFSHPVVLGSLVGSIYDTQLNLIGTFNTSTSVSLNKGDYVIQFDHGASGRSFTVQSSVLSN